MRQKGSEKTKHDKKPLDSAKVIKELQQKAAQLESEKQELFEKLQRISADYTNYQKRSPKQIADSVAYEKRVIIKSLLPGIDNFEHALASTDRNTGPEGTANVIKGVRLVFEHMLDALKAHGVERIEAVGAEFDPSRHEAVMQRSEEDEPDNIVLEQFQAGFTLNGQVIRPSKVIVNKLPAKDGAKADNERQESEPEAADIDEPKDNGD